MKTGPAGRIPTRSLTVVGDVARRGSAAGARSWAQMLDPYVRGRRREERLTVNYRTPAEIMAVTVGVLVWPLPASSSPPRAVRFFGPKCPPWQASPQRVDDASTAPA